MEKESYEHIKDRIISDAAKTFADSFSIWSNFFTGRHSENTFSDKVVKSYENKSPVGNIIQEYMKMRKMKYEDEIPF